MHVFEKRHAFLQEKMQPGAFSTAFLRRFRLLKSASKTTVKHDVFENAKKLKKHDENAKKKTQCVLQPRFLSRQNAFFC